MDLDLAPRYVDFRDECRTWLQEHHPGRIASMDTAVGFEEHREWERVLFDGGWSVTSLPSISSAPRLMSSRPPIMRSSVDLPQPDGPTKTTNSPSLICRSTPLITCASPYHFSTALR